MNLAEHRSGESPFLEVAFGPNLRLVSLIRIFASQFYEEILADADLIGRVELATHELLENAVKYASDSLTRVRVDCHLRGGQPRVEIRTWNRPRPGDLEVIERLVAEVNAAPDPTAFYQVLMERSSRRTDGSGLGLGRVRAEAGMQLSLQVDDGLLCITAVTEGERRAESAGR